MSDFSNLIERLEKAKGPDREIDAEISRVCRLCDPSSFYDETGDCLQWYEHHPFGSTTAAELCEQELLSYTKSIDAALTLVPACCKDWDWRVRNATDVKVNLYFPSAEKLEVFQGRSNVLAIALCIAALEAREAKG